MTINKNATGSMSASIDDDFGPGWRPELAGSGAVVPATPGVTRAQAPFSSDVAVTMRIYAVAPGDEVTISIWARMSTPGTGRFGLQLNSGTWAAFGDVTSSSWRQYFVSYKVPIHINVPSYVRIVVGMPGGSTGAIDFMRPRLTFKESKYGAPRVLAKGAISLDNSGGASPSAIYDTVGISSAVYTPADQTLTLNIPSIPGTNQIRPVISMDMTTEGNLKLIPKIKSYTANPGKIEVQFVDCTTGLVVNLVGSLTAVARLHIIALL